jgi:hypothetical protein
MKQLFVNGNATDFFFSKDSNFDDIFDWVHEQAMFDSKNIFNLNEQHSCSVSNSVDGICISGDEDFKEITIEDIAPIF